MTYGTLPDKSAIGGETLDPSPNLTFFVLVVFLVIFLAAVFVRGLALSCPLLLFLALAVRG